MYHLLPFIKANEQKNNVLILLYKTLNEEKKTKGTLILPAPVILYVTSPWGPASRSVALTLNISVPTSVSSGI